MLTLHVASRQVAYITHYKTITTVQDVPALTTVTNIGLTVDPRIEVVKKIETKGAPQYFTETVLVTHTSYNQPRATVTEQFPYNFDNTQHQQVAVTQYVTVTVAGNQGPGLISTVANNVVSYTPAYYTVTVTNSVPYTTTVLQQSLETVTVNAPCGGGGGGNTGNAYDSY